MTTTRTRTLTALSIATVLALLVALPFGLFIWVAVLKADNMRLAAELEDAQGRLADVEANVVRVPFVRIGNPTTKPNVVVLPPRVPKQRGGGES